MTILRVLIAFNQDFYADTFSAELAHSWIVLLYKKSNLIIMKNYRLITLLNTNYKIITKASVRRFIRFIRVIKVINYVIALIW